MRSIIVGNSGSGKTWLATRLGERSGAHVVHLDDIFWEPGGFEQKRSPDEVARLIDAHRAETNWIVEGVYGDLAGEFIPDADVLLWLDFPWSACRRRIESRASAGDTYMGRKPTERSLRDLLNWAEAYYSRGGWCSLAAHLALFNNFSRRRYRLRTAKDVRDYLDAA
jgi:adenylate kinase family enzyme